MTKELIQRVIASASQSLADYCISNSIHYVVTGSSGGLDSAVTLGLAQRAYFIARERGFDLHSVGVIMPCNSHPDAERLGREAIRKFGAYEILIDLSDLFQFANDSVISSIDSQIRRVVAHVGSQMRGNNGNDWAFWDTWEESSKIAQGNIKARLRMTFGTYHVARMLRGMVLSTDNLSEYWMGFWTLGGDVGDYGMCQNVLKGTEMYEIARCLGVPQGIIDARPDDGLGVISGGDEAQLGANYPTVDHVMISLIKQGFDPDGPMDQLSNLPPVDGVSNETVYKLAKRCLSSVFKRRGTLNLTREQLGLPSITDL